MLFIFLRSACCLILCLSFVHARTFTDNQDRKIEAEITKIEGAKVTLKLDKNGKSFEVPIDTLSKEDQKYVKNWKQEKESGESDGSEEEVTDEAKPNFDDPWPKLVSTDINIDINVAEEDENKKRFVYHSPNYEFICDVRLSKNVVKKFATLFEATREYCRLLPIATMKAHVPGAQFRNKILLFETKETYIANGGPPSSAGVYKSRGKSGIVMVPLTSLGVKKVGNGYMYDYKGQNKVLPHELVHQLTDREYYSPGSVGWFSEGLSDYVAVTPYRSGKYNVKTNISSIKEYATSYGKKGRGGRNLGEEIYAPDLKGYMLQSYSSFVNNANFNYGFGLLVTTYFFHMEDDTTNIINFLKALKEGKKGEEALDVLLNGRSWDEMEAQIAKAWRSKGVKITFR